MKRGILFIALASLLGANAGCETAYRKSIGAELAPVLNRTYKVDFNTAWQATLDALKSFRLDVSNREGGVVQTRWIDNTAEKNFSDSITGGENYLKAQYRLKVVVAKGSFEGKPSVRVTVNKEQLVLRDVLEEWHPVSTDSVEESTLLYRIGRLILLKTKLARLEEEKTRKEMQERGLPVPNESAAPATDPELDSN